MDSISSISFDLVAAKETDFGLSNSQVSVFDVANFESLQRAQASPPAQDSVGAVDAAEKGGFQAAMEVLTGLNGDAASLGREALQFSADKKDLTPSEMLNLTVQANEFLFQSQLTANVANKTSDGIQQLFRQQS